jgi:hypothetical protein
MMSVVLRGNQKLSRARTPLLVHHSIQEILLRHMSSKPVSGQCDKPMLLGALPRSGGMRAERAQKSRGSFPGIFKLIIPASFLP